MHAQERERKDAENEVLPQRIWRKKMTEKEVTSGGHEVVDFTRSRVKTKSKLTDLMKISRIEGYNGK